MRIFHPLVLFLPIRMENDRRHSHSEILPANSSFPFIRPALTFLTFPLEVSLLPPLEEPLLRLLPQKKKRLPQPRKRRPCSTSSSSPLMLPPRPRLSRKSSPCLDSPSWRARSLSKVFPKLSRSLSPRRRLRRLLLR